MSKLPSFKYKKMIFHNVKDNLLLALKKCVVTLIVLMQMTIGGSSYYTQH